MVHDFVSTGQLCRTYLEKEKEKEKATEGSLEEEAKRLGRVSCRDGIGAEERVAASFVLSRR